MNPSPTGPPGAHPEKILAIIASDPAPALRVLRAGNSAAAGGSSRVSSVRQAWAVQATSRLASA